MLDLAVRTLSQSLQAFLPVAFALAWLGRVDRVTRRVVRWAVCLAVPGSYLAGQAFRSTSYQARWEATLAVTAALVGVAAWRRLGEPVTAGTGTALAPRPQLAQQVSLLVAAATLLVVVRQTMEIGAVLLVAVVELRSADALVALVAGLGIGLLFAVCAWALLRSLDREPARLATRAFAAAFVALATWYAVHEASEAGLLPWSEWIHAATEPYGPDGLHGKYLSALLVVVPIGAVASSFVAARVTPRIDAIRSRMTPRRAVASAAFIVLASVAAFAVAGGALEQRGGAPAATLASVASRPHVFYRHTGDDADYGKLGMTPLDLVGSPRASTGLPCERVAWAAGHGVCLQADRGVFTTYKAVLFDKTFRPRATLKLDGPPSRTRVSSDGRLAAITVFVTGHGYDNVKFSTKTIIVDGESGDELGELEQFSTWRDGARFQAPDFNFWGVTFTSDGRTFYASLGTGGKTYLVKGDLVLRRLTVMRENLECPSLSPDGRTIAFKKRVGPRAGDWRIHLLDLATMAERPLTAETHVVDDQIEWLDDTHVLYAIPRPSSAVTDVWVAPVDGSAPARVFLAQASSPSVAR